MVMIMANSNLNLVVALASVLAALVINCAAQTTHEVGGSTGWRVPTGGAQFYSSWANSQTFRVGDVLTFTFAANQHNVAQVTKANFDNCSSSNTIGSVITSSPARIVLNTTGPHYFICAVPRHCAAGQKVAINVASSSTTTPTPIPNPSPSPTTQSPTPAPTSGGTPPSSRSATSLVAGFGVAGVSLALLTALFV